MYESEGKVCGNRKKRNTEGKLMSPLHRSGAATKGDYDTSELTSNTL